MSDAKQATARAARAAERAAKVEQAEAKLEAIINGRVKLKLLELGPPPDMAEKPPKDESKVFDRRLADGRKWADIRVCDLQAIIDKAKAILGHMGLSEDEIAKIDAELAAVARVEGACDL